MEQTLKSAKFKERYLVDNELNLPNFKIQVSETPFFKIENKRESGGFSSTMKSPIMENSNLHSILDDE